MKKLLVTFFIAIALSGLFTPMVSYALEPIFGRPNEPFRQAAQDIIANPKSTPEQKARAQIDLDKIPKPQRQEEAVCDRSATFGLGAFSTACIIDTIYIIVDVIGNTILSAAAWILWLCGVVFNLAMVQFVVQMKTRVGEIQAIYVVWQTVRDVANMFFIFILLVIAIQTILRMGDYKKLLTNVILVALFVNFSFFVTGVMIDASNIIALQFYNGFASGNCNGSSANTGFTAWVNSGDGCMSQTIVNSMKLASIYDTTQKDLTPSAPGKPVVLSSRQGVWAFLVTILMGSALMVIAGGVFLASAIMVFYRFVVLVFALMLSPLAFAALALPAAKKYWTKWWNKLTDQLIFAPVYFMFLWIVMKIIQSEVVHPDGSYTSAFKGNGTTLFGLISGFTIIIMLLIYSLTLAKELGAEGTTLAGKVSGKFQDFARRSTIGLATRSAQLLGRNTIGKTAYSIANSKAMKGFTAGSPTLSKLISKPLDSLASQGFGGKIGYDKALEGRKKAQVATAKFVGETGLLVKGRNETDADFKARQKAEEAAGRERKAKFAARIGGYDNALTTRLSNKLGITAALRSNKEAYADISKQTGKDASEEETREKRKTDLQNTLNAMHKLQGTMGHNLPIPVIDGKAKAENLADETNEEKVKDQEITELAKIEAETVSLQAKISAKLNAPQKDPAKPVEPDVTTEVTALAKQIGEKRKLEKNRKDFDALKNKINNLQDRIDRDNEATKISTAAGKTTPPPAAPSAPSTS